MHTYNLIINYCRTWQTIKGVAKLFPDLDAITTTAFIIKTVDAVDTCTFMISSKNEKVFGVFKLVSK
jgi:hypothetical protein